MKVLSTTSLTRLIELIKSSFLSADNIVTTQTISCPADSEVVHNTGDETINGNKTFSGLGTFTNYNAFWKTPYNIIVRSTSIENGVTPSSNQYMGIEFRDKNDVRVGWIGLAKKTDGTQQIELQKQGSTSGFTAPTPPTGDSSSNIATTAFVKAQGYAVDSNVVHKTDNETIAGNKTFSGTTLVVTPAVSDNSRKPVTTAYIETKFKVVSTLPAFPDSDTYYFIPE